MDDQFKHGNEFANEVKDERLADKVVNRVLWFIAGVLFGAIMVNIS